MTVDPRTLATMLRATSNVAAADLVEQVVVPLHDAWLKAKPPCPTCGGKWRVLCTLPRMHEGPCDAPEPHRDGQWLCPDCSDGVLPFDKWTAGLVALWTGVHCSGLISLSLPGEDTKKIAQGWNECLAYLRQIGGAR